MVRNVSVPGAKTLHDINKLLPNILNRHHEIESFTVQVGFNDIMKGSSEQLKIDFKEQIGSLLDTNKHPIICGPLPSLNRGIERFSRLFTLHNWLRDYCSFVGVTFIDNFDSFWKQSSYFELDRIQPNHLGSWILSQHCTAALRQ
jgi:hypothetical protein